MSGFCLNPDIHKQYKGIQNYVFFKNKKIPCQRPCGEETGGYEPTCLLIQKVFKHRHIVAYGIATYQGYGKYKPRKHDQQPVFTIIFHKFQHHSHFFLNFSAMSLSMDKHIIQTKKYMYVSRGVSSYDMNITHAKNPMPHKSNIIKSDMIK